MEFTCHKINTTNSAKNQTRKPIVIIIIIYLPPLCFATLRILSLNAARSCNVEPDIGNSLSTVMDISRKSKLDRKDPEFASKLERKLIQQRGLRIEYKY